VTDLAEFVTALEIDTLGLGPADLYEIRVDILRELLASWRELKHIAASIEPSP
jgi:hypothetical protein